MWIPILYGYQLCAINISVVKPNSPTLTLKGRVPIFGGVFSPIGPLLELKLRWNLGRGDQLDFWRDEWLRGQGPLLSSITNGPQLALELPSIYNFLNKRGEWDHNKLGKLGMPSIINTISNVSPPCADAEEDNFVWGEHRWIVLYKICFL